jgi:ElaA protein
MAFHWQVCHFSELTPHDVYDVLQLREAVFVLEQQCLYQDLDNQDFHAHHLLGRVDGILLAYARLFAPGQRCEEASIGRVATAQACRRTGSGRELMREAIDAVSQRWGAVPIRIGAQTYLQAFYESFGFRRVGDDYVEDGIPHLPMRRPPEDQPAGRARSES